jgi:hypothetical protein
MRRPSACAEAGETLTGRTHTHCERVPDKEGKMKPKHEAERGWEMTVTDLRKQATPWMKMLAEAKVELAVSAAKTAGGSALTKTAAERRAVYGIVPPGAVAGRAPRAGKAAASDEVLMPASVVMGRLVAGTLPAA